MNRLTDVQKRLIVLGIGLLLILFGAVQAVFKLDFFIKHKKIFDEITFVLMLVAAVLLFAKKKPKPESQEADKAVESSETTETAGAQDRDSK
jgi:hypothetical protein